MRKCEVRSVKMNKKLRSNLITYAMVIIAYLICQLADLLKALIGTLLVRSGTWANDITKIPEHG